MLELFPQLEPVLPPSFPWPLVHLRTTFGGILTDPTRVDANALSTQGLNQSQLCMGLHLFGLLRLTDNQLQVTHDILQRSVAEAHPAGTADDLLRPLVQVRYIQYGLPIPQAVQNPLAPVPVPAPEPPAAHAPPPQDQVEPELPATTAPPTTMFVPQPVRMNANIVK